MIAADVTIAARCLLSPRVFVEVSRLAARYERKIRGTVEIIIVGDRRMRTLNRLHRGLDRPTDVLSFAWSEDRSGPPSPLLGQLYLDYIYIIRQAKRFKVSHREEAVRMAAHGLLHLAGHDHKQSVEAKKMFDLQEKIVSAARQQGLI